MPGKVLIVGPDLALVGVRGNPVSSFPEEAWGLGFRVLRLLSGLGFKA